MDIESIAKEKKGNIKQERSLVAMSKQMGQMDVELAAAMFVRVAREYAGLSQRELGLLLDGMTQARISQMENPKKSHSPNLRRMEQIAELCGLRVSLRFEKASSAGDETRGDD